MLSRRILTALLISFPIVGVGAYINRSMFSNVTPFANQAASTTNSSSKITTVALTPTAANGLQTAIFAGGCFWGVEAVFEHLKGVSSVVSGYSGGTQATANYETVSNGTTAHPYIVVHDLPKLDRLRQEFPALTKGF